MTLIRALSPIQSCLDIITWKRFRSIFSNFPIWQRSPASLIWIKAHIATLWSITSWAYSQRGFRGLLDKVSSWLRACTTWSGHERSCLFVMGWATSSVERDQSIKALRHIVASYCDRVSNSENPKGLHWSDIVQAVFKDSSLYVKNHRTS